MNCNICGTHTVQMECYPGMKPDQFIAAVLQDTGLPSRKPTVKYNMWTWDYNDIPADEYHNAQMLLSERITVLYQTKLIRYGSW